jgi:hypothetical protein
MVNLVRPFETFTNVGGTMQNPNPILGGRHGPYIEGSGNMSPCQLDPCTCRGSHSHTTISRDESAFKPLSSSSNKIYTILFNMSQITNTVINIVFRQAAKSQFQHITSN